MSRQKTALITGASQGIGRATAMEFARRGYCLALNYLHSEPEAQQLAEEIQTKYGAEIPVSYTHLDVYKRQLFVKASMGKRIP